MTFKTISQCPSCGSTADHWQRLGLGWCWCDSCLKSWDQKARVQSEKSKERIQKWLEKNAKYMFKDGVMT